MRFVSRSEHLVSRSNVLPIRASHSATRDDDQLAAFRGLLIAGSVSVLFWGVCLTAVWLIALETPLPAAGYIDS